MFARDHAIGTAAALRLTLRALLASCLYPLAGYGQQAPTAAMASPGSYVDAATLAQRLRSELANRADPALAPIGINAEYSIQEVRRNKPGPPAIHAGWTELHYILDGSAEFVTGGIITGDREHIIEGGQTRTVRKGDAIIVPADTPHWYRKIDGSLTVLEVRFRSPG
jgi:mannose-6-phosphate isomerase-like protein (cupin superfamily)